MKNIPEELLYEEYVVKEKPMSQIAKEQGVSTGLVFNRIREYHISPRHSLTNKAREKISRANTGRTSPRRGVHLSDETKEKMRKAHTGKFSKRTTFGGHTKLRGDGYVAVYLPTHPNATKSGYVMEHILVMEKAIGRYVTKDEVVHHKNHVRNDNRLENLELMSSKEHSRFHLEERRKKGELKHFTRPVVNITTGQVFESIKQASSYYGVSPTNIRKVCNGKRKHCKNCEWKYVEGRNVL